VLLDIFDAAGAMLILRRQLFQRGRRGAVSDAAREPAASCGALAKGIAFD